MARAAAFLVLLLLTIVGVGAAPAPGPAHAPLPAAMSQEDLAVNVQKFSEMYRLATQLMNLGGNILNNAQGGGSSGASRFDSGNGIGDVVRPTLRSVRDYDAPSSASSLFGSRSAQASSSASEYGGGPLGAGPGGVHSARTSALDNILSTFFGSSLSGSDSGSSMTDFFSPNSDEYGSRNSRFGSTGSGSNIEALVGALTRGGARPAQPEPESRSFLSGLFGR